MDFVNDVGYCTSLSFDREEARSRSVSGGCTFLGFTKLVVRSQSLGSKSDKNCLCWSARGTTSALQVSQGICDCLIAIRGSVAT